MNLLEVCAAVIIVIAEIVLLTVFSEWLDSKIMSYMKQKIDQIIRRSKMNDIKIENE